MPAESSEPYMMTPECVSCRIVRVELSDPGPPSTWQDVVPQHRKDLLRWASALKVPSLFSQSFQPFPDSYCGLPL